MQEDWGKEVIAFDNCGHGLLDLRAYDAFLNGRLEDYEPTTIEVPRIVN